jgi:hypothetical protein
MPKKSTVEITKLGRAEYEIIHPAQNQICSVRLEAREWILDVFDSRIKNVDKSYLYTETLYEEKSKKKDPAPDWNTIFEYLGLLK